MDLLRIDRVRKALNQFNPIKLGLGEMRSASVLLLLDDSMGKENIDVILTRRANFLGVHSGQVAFPGGGTSLVDSSAADTALREAEEEIELHRENVELLGPLSDMITISDFHITPFVGYLLHNQEFAANPMEVDRVFCVPLAVLADLSRWEREQHTYKGQEVALWHLHYDGEDIWGVTAHILFEFLRVIGLPTPEVSIWNVEKSVSEKG